jgi:hypothetical protein
MNQSLSIGASVPCGLKHFAAFQRLKLGECALTLLPAEKAEALAVARYCRRKRIRLYFSELLYRGDTDRGLCWSARRRMPRSQFYSKADLEEIFDAAGECYGGRMTLGEVGGMLYWPKEYLINRRVGNWPLIPAVRTVDQAHKAYVEYCRRIIEYERKELGRGPLLDVDSALVFKYHVEAGLDVLCLESMPGDPHRMHAAVRGAGTAFDKSWGTHIAMACYGGTTLDTLWQKRWKSAVYHAILSGAGFVWPECGYVTYRRRTGEQLGFRHPEMKRSRLTLREAYQFSKVHRRPLTGPKVRLGVVYGNHDGAPGLWNPCAWGQARGAKWLNGPAERSWELVDSFHRKQDWPKESIQGDMDFSGNPPYGQYDIVPVEASLDILKGYSCLLFLGWNTMTAGIYSKLRAYVKSGGRLIMYLPHLSVETDRGKPIRLYRNGDFRDLFGVRITGRARTDVYGLKYVASSSVASYAFPLWGPNTDPRFMGLMTPSRGQVTSGRIIAGYDGLHETGPDRLRRQPFLIENSLGKGTAWLVAAWQCPADDGLRPFTDDLLRTVLAGEQGDIRLLAGDRVRYAVYEDRSVGAKVVYLLNTDPDCPSPARLWVRGRMTEFFQIPSNELRLAYVRGNVAVVPEDKMTDVTRWRVQGRRHALDIFSVRKQTLEIHNLGGAQLSLVINGTRIRCRPGKTIFALPRRADPSRKEFFAADFLEEPSFPYTPAPLPY